MGGLFLELGRRKSHATIVRLEPLPRASNVSLFAPPACSAHTTPSSACDGELIGRARTVTTTSKPTSRGQVRPSMSALQGKAGSSGSWQRSTRHPPACSSVADCSIAQSSVPTTSTVGGPVGPVRPVARRPTGASRTLTLDATPEATRPSVHEPSHRPTYTGSTPTQLDQDLPRPFAQAIGCLDGSCGPSHFRDNSTTLCGWATGYSGGGL